MTGHEKIFKSGTGHSSGCRCSGNWSDDRWCFNGRNDHGLNLSKDGLGSVVRQTAKYVSFGDEDDWNQDWDEIDESDSKEAAGTNGEIYLVVEYQNSIFLSEQENFT